MAIKKRGAKPFIDHEATMADMESSDYEHLIEVFDKHFGDYVDLLR